GQTFRSVASLSVTEDYAACCRIHLCRIRLYGNKWGRNFSHSYAGIRTGLSMTVSAKNHLPEAYLRLVVSVAKRLYRAKTPHIAVNFVPDGDHGMIAGRAISAVVFDLCHGVQLAQVVRPRCRCQGHRDPHPAPRSLGAAPSNQQTSTPTAAPSDLVRPDPPSSPPAAQ